VSHFSAVAVSALAVQVNKLLACCFNLVFCLPYPYAHRRSAQQLVGGGRGSHCRLRDSTAHAVVVCVSGGEGWLVGWLGLFVYDGATNYPDHADLNELQTSHGAWCDLITRTL
jgi:hypothetical protein